VILVAFGIILLVFGLEESLVFTLASAVPNPVVYLSLLGSGLVLLVVGGSLIYLNRGMGDNGRQWQAMESQNGRQGGIAVNKEYLAYSLAALVFGLLYLYCTINYVPVEIMGQSNWNTWYVFLFIGFVMIAAGIGGLLYTYSHRTSTVAS
jgi:hypothetical protein